MSGMVEPCHEDTCIPVRPSWTWSFAVLVASEGRVTLASCARTSWLQWWSVRLLPAHMCEDVHSTRQLHCQRWSGQCHAKHGINAASVHNNCLDITVCYLQTIFTRNRKLKQYVVSMYIVKLSAFKLGVLKNQCMSFFVGTFFQICLYSNF